MDKMVEIDQQKIGMSLVHLSLSEKDHLKQGQLMAAMNKLNGEPFDQQTFEQIWDQCKLNSRAEVRVAEFMEYIQKAQEILLESLKKVVNSLKKLEEQKSDSNDFQQQRYREKTNYLYQQSDGIKQNLTIIRKPFLYLYSSVPSLAYERQKTEARNYNADEHLFEYQPDKSSATVTKILYLVVVLLLVTWIGSQMFNQFVDLTLCFIILMGYACNTISRKIIRFNLILLAISFGISVVWLALYVSSLWNPPTNYEYSKTTIGYLRLSVGMLFLGQMLKLILIYCYLTIMQMGDGESCTVSIGQKQFSLQSEPLVPNPTKHPLGAALYNLFNRPKAPLQDAESPDNS